MQVGTLFGIIFDSLWTLVFSTDGKDIRCGSAPVPFKYYSQVQNLFSRLTTRTASYLRNSSHIQGALRSQLSYGA